MVELWAGDVATFALKVKMDYFSFLSNSFLRADSLSIKWLLETLIVKTIIFTSACEEVEGDKMLFCENI